VINEMHTFTLKTKAPQIMQDITKAIASIVKKTGITQGRISVFIPHTTAAVTINENADPDVEDDMVLGIDKAFPDRPQFNHMEGNSHAHIKTSMTGVEQTVIVDDGRLVLGTWQGIYFCEYDGPRNRKVHIHVMGT